MNIEEVVVDAEQEEEEETELANMNVVQRRNYLKDKIQEKFDTQRWNSKIEVYNNLPKEYTEYMSIPCFYKYLQNMNCHEIYNGKYGFSDNKSKVSFSEFLEYRQYNMFITFIARNPSLTTFLVEKLNNDSPYSTRDDKKEYHCIGLHDSLICFYCLFEDQDEIERNDEIRNLIEKNAKKYCVHTVE